MKSIKLRSWYLITKHGITINPTLQHYRTFPRLCILGYLDSLKYLGIPGILVLQMSTFTIMAHPGKEPRPLDPSIIFGGVEETSEEERTTHAGSCHCGAVKFNVTLKWPFPKYPVNRCSCSICSTTGYLLVYPCRRDIEWLQGIIYCFVFGENGRKMRLKIHIANTEKRLWRPRAIQTQLQDESP